MSEPSKEATDVLCRLLLPLPMQAMDARMRQVGNVLEFYTVPNEKE